MAEKDKANNQTFSFDTVAVLVATILENGGNLGMKEYKRMSALDGTRGEHGFNHLFRDVKKRAKEINEEAKGSELTPVKKTKAAGGGAKKKDEGTGGKKRARKPKKGEEVEKDAGCDDDDEESPSKKVKPDLEENGEADAPVEEDEMAF